MCVCVHVFVCMCAHVDGCVCMCALRMSKYNNSLCIFNTLQTVDNVATTNSTKQLEQKSQDSEGKAAAVFSDESSESLVSVRSDENISIKGSPVKKATVAHSVTSSEPLETSTEEVVVTVIVCMYSHTLACVTLANKVLTLIFNDFIFYESKFSDV